MFDEEQGPIASKIEALLRTTLNTEEGKEIVKTLEGHDYVGLHIYAGDSGGDDSRHVCVTELDTDFIAHMWKGQRFFSADFYDGPRVKVNHLGGDSFSLGIQFELESKMVEGQSSEHKPLTVNLGMGIRQAARFIVNALGAYWDFVEKLEPDNFAVLMGEDTIGRESE